MPLATVLTERLGLSHPIVQAPLAGGGDTPALVAAVAEAGALGFIGAAYLTPAQIAEAARTVRAHTRRPFGINLFAPVAPAPPARDPDAALARVAPFYDELGLPRPRCRADAGRRRRADGHGLPHLRRGRRAARLQGRHPRRPRGRHAHHARVLGAAGARHRQPVHARGRGRRRAAVPAAERADAA